jgi:arylsulfatase I/J
LSGDVQKLDAGMASPTHTPYGRGFDTSLQGPAAICKGYYEEHFFQDRLLDIIDTHDSSDPLFLYHAARVAHAPLQAPWSFLQALFHVDDPVRRAYQSDGVGARIPLDDVIGNVTQALKAKDLWDNTLIIVHVRVLVY